VYASDVCRVEYNSFVNQSYDDNVTAGRQIRERPNIVKMSLRSGKNLQNLKLLLSNHSPPITL